MNSLGNDVFWGCENLKFITVSPNNECYSNDSYGVLFDKNKTTLLKFPEGKKLDVYTIPNSVEYIDSYSFVACYGLSNVKFGNSVKTIGESAFDSCENLAGVTISNSVTSIGPYAFYGCTRLKTIQIPGSVTNIGDSAFNFCEELTSVVISEGVTNIECYAFHECSNLETLKLPASLKTIDENAFELCDNLKYINYAGTEEQWNSVKIGIDNESLTNCEIHYGVK